MSDQERRDIEFSRLNVLGKIIYAGGAAARAISGGIDRVLNHVADVVVETEKAFREGADENIEDARILEERKERKTRPPKSVS